MKLFRIFYFILLLFMCSSAAFAYKAATHAALSGAALKQSNLYTDPSLLKDLGLNVFSSNQLFPDPYTLGNYKFSITKLIMDGATYEDNDFRSLNHFYNPINDKPLTEAGAALGYTSPDWALEDVFDIPADPDFNISPQNDSYKDAMNYYFLALTSQTKDERDTNWGKLFQALGQVIHHVQDMAQPDHVRNDQHNDWTDPSYYERYTDTLRANSDPTFYALETGGTYPIPSFAMARDYWTTKATDTAVVDRRGMADFTNRNFVSKDTNFLYDNGSFISDPDFPLPEPINASTPNSVDIADPGLMGTAGQALCDHIKAISTFNFPGTGCYIDFVSTNVTDALTGTSSVNNRAASYSIFDKKLQDYNVDPFYTHLDGTVDAIDKKFTLNQFNFRAEQNYLIPRAVAYSAGLINHFFTERFSATADPANGNFIIKNTSGNTLYGSFYLYGETSGATLSGGTGNVQLIETWPIPASGIADGTELSVTIPELSQYKKDFKIIYRGKVGSAKLDSIDVKTITSQNAIASVSTDSDIYIYSGGVLQPDKLEADRSTTYHYNFRNYTFTAHAESSLAPGDFIGNPSIHQATNYFWGVKSGYDICIAEEIGTYDDPDGAVYSNIWFNYDAPSEYYIQPDTTGVTAAACDAIPYGYHTGTWSRGWLSKFSEPPLVPLPKTGFMIGANCYLCTTNTNPFNFNISYSINMTKYDSGVGGCVDVTLDNISPNVSSSYATYDDYVLNDPYTAIANFLPPQLLDYRCN